MILTEIEILRYTVIIASSVISGAVAKVIADYLLIKYKQDDPVRLLVFLVIFLIAIWFVINGINNIVSWWTNK